MANTSEILEFCKKLTQENIDFAKKFFGGIDSRLLNRKPNAESWSAAQCLNHIIKSGRLYFDKIQEALTNATESKNNNFPYSHSFFGKRIISSVNPSNQKKQKTFKVFEPSSDEFNPEIIEEFINSRRNFIELTGKMGGLNLRTIKITSPVSKFIRLNLGDPLAIIPLHDKRHLNQAERVINFLKADFNNDA